MNNNHFLSSAGLDFTAGTTTTTIAAGPTSQQQPSTSSAPGPSSSGNPRIIYLDRVCRTCLMEKEKEQLKDLFEFCLADTVMACADISVEESDGLPCHVCLDCLREVERIFSFRQMAERSDVTIRNLIEKSVVIKQDSETKYEVLNVVLTDANGNTETSAVVVPIEELRFQLVNGGSAANVPSPPAETINIPIVEIDKAVELPGFHEVQQPDEIEIAIPKDSLDLDFPSPTELLITQEDLVDEAPQSEEDDDPITTMDPSELLNEPAPTPPLDIIVEEQQLPPEEIISIENIKQELSEFIGGGGGGSGSNCEDIPKDQEIDDNDDDEMIHVDYLKDALTEEYIQIMEKQLAPSVVTRQNNSVQDRLEQENLNSLINDEERVIKEERDDREQQGWLECDVEMDDDDDGAMEGDDDGGGDDDGDYSALHCKLCDTYFEDQRQYKRHMKKHSEKRFECEYCSRKFAEQSLLRNHLLRHTGEKSHVCKLCDARFYDRNLLNIHLRTHTDDRPHGCDTCGKRFKTKSLLNTHNKSHLGEKSHICTVCGKGFTLSWQLKAHLRTHTNERPYECPYCHKRFNQNGNLMIHIRIHTGERPFQCTLCDKAYPSQGELSGHMRQHTGEKKVKKTTCTVCGKAFAGNGDLKIHMRTHTKEKPYSCQVCGKSFMLHVHLTVHMRSHTGEKPFVCSICGKGFATNYQLKNHTFVHTGEKNYACDVCNRRFSCSANRNTHRKTHDRKIS